MIRGQITAIALVTLLMVSALTTCLLSVRWFLATQAIQRLQARADAMTRTSNLMQQLATEAVDYGRKNPAINPLLDQLNQRAAARHNTNMIQQNAPKP